MQTSKTAQYICARTRFYRLRDSQLFNGWIQSFEGDRLIVEVPEAQPCDPTDAFEFEIPAYDHAAVFQAELQSVEAATNGKHTPSASHGNNHKSTFTLSVTEPIRTVAPTDGVRYRVTGMVANATGPDLSEEPVVIDIAQHGVGLHTATAWPSDASVQLEIPTRLGAVHAVGKVRYCQEAPSLGGGYRVGVMFVNVSRTDASRWNRLFEEGSIQLG